MKELHNGFLMLGFRVDQLYSCLLLLVEVRRPEVLQYLSNLEGKRECGAPYKRKARVCIYSLSWPATSFRLLLPRSM